MESGRLKISCCLQLCESVQITYQHQACFLNLRVQKYYLSHRGFIWTGNTLCSIVMFNWDADCNRDTEDAVLIPGSGRFPGVENSNPLQYSCLENSISNGDWGCKEVTWLSIQHINFSSSKIFFFLLLSSNVAYCYISNFL